VQGAVAQDDPLRVKTQRARLQGEPDDVQAVLTYAQQAGAGRYRCCAPGGTGTAEAQVNRSCKPVTSEQWRATQVTAFNMGCPSARNKLRRWLRRDRPLHSPPSRPGAWDCRRIAIRGRNRQCSISPRRRGATMGFVWRQRRR
jgi:hypothetical protein